MVLGWIKNVVICLFCMYLWINDVIYLVPLQFTTKCDFVALAQVNDMSLLTVNKSCLPFIFLLTVNSFINGIWKIIINNHKYFINGKILSSTVNNSVNGK